MGLKWKVVLVGMLALGLEMALCDKATLMEVPLNKKWAWTASGWNRQTVSDVVFYDTCDISLSSPPDNWLTSDHIGLKRARWIEVNMVITITRCAVLSGSKSYCHHSFGVYQRTANSDVVQSPPTGYQKISDVTAINLFNRTSQFPPRDSVTLNAEIKDIGSNIFLAFRDQGACITMVSVKVSYYFCPKIEENAYLMSLPETASPYVSSSPTKVNGSCIDNSVVDGGIFAFALCQTNGEWNISSKCVCKEGFAHKARRCEECPPGTYKTDTGNKECTPCPTNTAPNPKRTSCECQENFYRAPKEDYQHNCSAIPSSPRNAKTIFNASAVVITWTPPKENGGRLDLYYEVTYSVGCTKCSADCQDEKYRMRNTSTPQLSVTGLKPCANYTFLIYAKNGVNEVAKKTSEPLSVLIPSRESDRESKKDPKKVAAIYVIAGAVAGAVFVIILVLALVIFLRRRSNRRDAGYGKPQGTEMSCRLYIDPNNYADPLELLKNFASEIEKSNIKLEAVIGGGEFGDVYKGRLKGQDGSTTVAVKILKQGSSARNRDDFLFEASIMGQFDHINVIRLEGVVTKTLPMMIVTEYMENGSLEGFLKSCNKNLTHLQLIGMARGVAAGMEYLAGMNFIHRDLAARNILVGENMSSKVADFGLSRELDDDPESEYQTQGGKIAIRWTAPEALRYRTFSSASDVWSFGIVLWEIMSFAERPYWDWDNFKVMDRVQAGFRMPAPLVCKTNANQPDSSGVPVACPKIIHDVMMRCWEEDKNKRPKFSEIVKNLDELIRSPEMLNNGYSPTKSNPTTDFNDVKSVHDWLDSIKMERYVPNFEKAGYQDLRQVSALDDAEIRKLGVQLAGHRNKITKSIKLMKTHFTNPGLESE